jgi:hypothetical protein
VRHQIVPASEHSRSSAPTAARSTGGLVTAGLTEYPEDGHDAGDRDAAVDRPPHFVIDVRGAQPTM